MGHAVEGFDLTFTSRQSWKVIRRLRGEVVDAIPVTWTKGRRRDPETSGQLLDVWFRDPAEAQRIRSSAQAFVVAEAASISDEPHLNEIKGFIGIFEVMPTGRVGQDESVETRLLHRLRAT